MTGFDCPEWQKDKEREQREQEDCLFCAICELYNYSSCKLMVFNGGRIALVILAVLMAGFARPAMANDLLRRGLVTGTKMDKAGNEKQEQNLENQPNAIVCERKWNETVKTAQKLQPNDTLNKLAILIPGLSQSQVIWRNVMRSSRSGVHSYTGHPFDLDGQRSAKEILKQGCGGSCGSCGKVLADALLKSGTDPNRVYLIDTVGESERRAACIAMQTGGRASVNGHQFILVEDMQDSWHLVNTTSPTLEEVPFVSPQEIERLMSDSKKYASDPIHIHPASKTTNDRCYFPSLVDGPPQKIFGDLVVFRVHQSLLYPNHDINQRVRDVVHVVPK